MKISKRYFSGFCFDNEEELFTKYLVKNDFTISGFSYGAIKAFEKVYNSKMRVDKLQLLSPAFFQNKDEKFKRMQLMYFSKNEKEYYEIFLKGVLYPRIMDLKKYFKIGTKKQLQELLNYTWDKNKLKTLIHRGVKIEIFLGEDDKIIDSEKVKEFFLDFATVYFIKEKGHLL